MQFILSIHKHKEYLQLIEYRILLMRSSSKQQYATPYFTSGAGIQEYLRNRNLNSNLNSTTIKNESISVASLNRNSRNKKTNSPLFAQSNPSNNYRRHFQCSYKINDKDKTWWQRPLSLKKSNNKTNLMDDKNRIYGIFDSSYIKFGHQSGSKISKTSNTRRQLTDQELLKKYRKNRSKDNKPSKSKSRQENIKQNISVSNQMHSSTPLQINSNHQQTAFNKNYQTNSLKIIRTLPIYRSPPLQIVKQIHHKPVIIHHFNNTKTQNQIKQNRKNQLLIQEQGAHQLQIEYSKGQSLQNDQKSPIKKLNFDAPEINATNKKQAQQKYQTVQIKQSEHENDQSLMQIEHNEIKEQEKPIYSNQHIEQIKEINQIENSKFQSTILKQLLQTFESCESEQQYLQKITQIISKYQKTRNNQSCQNKENQSSKGFKTVSTMFQTSESFFRGAINQASSQKKKKGLKILLKNKWSPYFQNETVKPANNQYTTFCQNLLSF